MRWAVMPAPWRNAGAVLAVAGLLAASPAPGSQQPTARPAASFACRQPMPSPAPGQITLAGVGYGPYHVGQNPNLKISPSSGEVAADCRPWPK